MTSRKAALMKLDSYDTKITWLHLCTGRRERLQAHPQQGTVSQHYKIQNSQMWQWICDSSAFWVSFTLCTQYNFNKLWLISSINHIVFLNSEHSPKLVPQNMKAENDFKLLTLCLWFPSGLPTMPAHWPTLNCHGYGDCVIKGDT